MVLATPDFGASGVIVLFLMAFWVILLALVFAGIFLGMRLRRNGRRTVRTLGLCLVLACCLAPLLCYLGPPHLVRIIYGNYPIGSYPSGKIERGMSAGEVVAILGRPHERPWRDNGETYIYWIDSCGIFYCAIDFGPDKRVTNIYGN